MFNDKSIGLPFYILVVTYCLHLGSARSQHDLARCSGMALRNYIPTLQPSVNRTVSTVLTSTHIYSHIHNSRGHLLPLSHSFHPFVTNNYTKSFPCPLVKVLSTPALTSRNKGPKLAGMLIRT